MCLKIFHFPIVGTHSFIVLQISGKFEPILTFVLRYLVFVTILNVLLLNSLLGAFLVITAVVLNLGRVPFDCNWIIVQLRSY